MPRKGPIIRRHSSARIWRESPSRRVQILSISVGSEPISREMLFPLIALAAARCNSLLDYDELELEFVTTCFSLYFSNELLNIQQP